VVLVAAEHSQKWGVLSGIAALEVMFPLALVLQEPLWCIAPDRRDLQECAWPLVVL